MRDIIYKFGCMNCISQMGIIGMITILIVAIIKIWYKTENKKMYEWLTIGISFVLALIIDTLLCVWFKANLYITVIIEEATFIIITPVLTKNMYDIYKALFQKTTFFVTGLSILKGGKYDEGNYTNTSIQTTISNDTNNQT